MKKAVAAQERTRMPLVEVLRSHPVELALGVGAVVAGVAITYVKTTFALSWATTDLGFERSDFLLVITVALVAQALVQPFGCVCWPRGSIPSKAVRWMLLPEIVLLPLMFVLVQTGSVPLAILGMGPRDGASRNVLRRVGRHPGTGFPHQCSVYRHLSVVPIVDRRICRNGPDGQPVSADANQLASGRS